MKWECRHHQTFTRFLFFSYDFNPSNNVSTLIAPLDVQFSHVSTSTPGKYTFHLFLKS